MTRPVLSFSTAIAAAVSTLFVSCAYISAPTGPPPGGFFRMHVFEEVRDQVLGSFVTEMAGAGVRADYEQDWFGAIGDVRSFHRFMDRQGYAYSPSNPRLPAEWVFHATDGPCYGQRAIGATVVYQGVTVPLTCFIEIDPARDYGYLVDGTPVYTGGDDKLVVGWNESLYPGESRTSPDGRLRLQYQYDGNLVLVRNGTPTWATDTFGPPGRAVMQGDGNFVIYNASGHAVWESNTDGYNGAFIAVQSNGCALMYHGNPQDIFIPWGTPTCDR